MCTLRVLAVCALVLAACRCVPLCVSVFDVDSFVTGGYDGTLRFQHFYATYFKVIKDDAVEDVERGYGEADRVYRSMTAEELQDLPAGTLLCTCVRAHVPAVFAPVSTILRIICFPEAKRLGCDVICALLE